MKTCGCGHPIDSDGYCLILGDAGEVHRVPRYGSRCVDCGEDVNP